MVKIYKILFLAVVLTFATQIVNAQNGTKESAIAKFPVVAGVDSRTYTLEDISYSEWCTRRTVRFATSTILSTSDVNASHFSFGTRPGEGVESVSYVGFINNQHIYQLTSVPRTNPANGFSHSTNGDFINDSDYFNLPSSGSVDAAPAVSIIDANTVQIPTYPQFEIVEYRWFRNGVFYTSTTNPLFDITEPGSYTVQLVMASGCVSLPSGSITFVTDVAGRIVKDCQVYPSPATTTVNVDGIDFRDGDYIIIASLDGKKVFTRSMKLGETNVTLNVEGLHNGVYFLSVYRGNIPYAYKRFLKN